MDSAPPPSGSSGPKDAFAIRPVPFADIVGEAGSTLEARLEKNPSYPDLWNRLGLYQAASGRLLDAPDALDARYRVVLDHALMPYLRARADTASGSRESL